MDHLTFKEWMKFANYKYDENDHLTAEEDYAEFCCKHSFWPIFN